MPPAVLRGSHRTVGQTKALSQLGLILAPLITVPDKLGPFGKLSKPQCPHASIHLAGCEDYMRPPTRGAGSGPGTQVLHAWRR